MIFVTLPTIQTTQGIRNKRSCIENKGFTLTQRKAKIIGKVLEVGDDWILTGNERNKYYPVNDEMIEFLKDHEDLRKELWQKIKNRREEN